MLALTALALAVASLVDDNSSALAPSDWQAIRAAHADARHAVEARGEAHTAFNHAQGLGIRFEDGCAHLEREGGGASVAFELERWGRADAFTPASDELAARAAGRRFERDFTGGLVEWWHNHDRGLEHGFTLAARPSGSGELFVDLALTTTLAPSIDTNARGLTLRHVNGAVALTYCGLVAFDTDGDLLPARLELVGDVLRIAVDDTDADYPLTIDPIVQSAYLKAAHNLFNNSFGTDVGVSGDTIVVGMLSDDSGATGVDGDPTDNSEPDSGGAYVFVRSGGLWAQQAYLKAASTDDHDRFATSVAIDGNTIVVGVPNEDGASVGVDGDPSSDGSIDSGAAYVFVRDGNVWTQQAYLKASNADVGDQFGVDVDISGDTIVVTSTNEGSTATGINGDQSNNDGNSVGAAYVFVRNGTTWTQQAYIKASNAGGQDFFGGAVAIDGDTIVVGAVSEDSNASGVNGDQSDNSLTLSGAVYVFVRQGSTWTQQAYVKPLFPREGDRFGEFLDVSNNTLVVCSQYEDSTATGINGNQADDSGDDVGAVFVFHRQGSNWAQRAYLKASNAEEDDFFGASASVSGDLIVVGAFGEDSASAGMFGDQGDNTIAGAGAAYVFRRSPSGWKQISYVKSSNPDALDRFGRVLAIDGTTLVVSAASEDGGATGVNGDSSDNSVFGAGAVYAFDIDSLPPFCIPPTPAVEAGALEMPVYFGAVATYPVVASGDFGACTITDVSVSFAAPKNGGGFHPFVPAALPPGATQTPSLPVTGAPATTQFAWTPNANDQVGQWRFTYTLLDEFGQESSCSVVVEVRECLLLVGIAKADVDLGGGDRLLVEPFFVLPILSEAVPHLTVPNDPLFIGLDVYAQAVMWNPVVFPSNPLQMSNRLHYRIGVDVTNDGNGSGLVIAPDPGAVHPGGVLKVTLGMAPN
jgi:hypothetical protein